MIYLSQATQTLNVSQPYTYSFNTQSSTHFSWGVFLVFLIIGLVLGIFYVVCLWKIFKKAGRPGWAAIIPVYNTWVTAEIAGKPGWWSLLTLIPFVNIIGFILFIIVDIELCKRFGKSVWFAVILIILLPIIGLPILAFGKAKYNADGQDNSDGGGGVSSHNPVNPGQQSPQANEPVLPPSPASTVTPTVNPVVSPPVVGNDMQPPSSQPVAPQVNQPAMHNPGTNHDQQPTPPPASPQ